MRTIPHALSPDRGETLRDASRRWMHTVNHLELAIVKGAVRGARRRGVHSVACALTRGGNGWLYPPLSAVVTLSVDSPARAILASAVSLGAALFVYPLLKRTVARVRPCEEDPSMLAGSPQPLDRYSCPSGHTMTAAAFGVPLAFAAPHLVPAVVMLCVAMAWSRVALGHHYVSDVCAGAMLGSAIGATVGATVL